MKYPGYASGKTELAEGNWYQFRVHNLIQLQDDAWYYVLQDINGLKHFLPAANYQVYGIKPGDEISCKIDKINCTGRIYLEPRHPRYTEGEVYDFETVKILDPGDGLILIVKETGGNIIEVSTEGHSLDDLKSKKIVQCRVKNIKKGTPILELV
jgi:hypothetical protein